ncbi:hypothetical protein [Krasilnikovia sp. MM14-A1259]|uniref:hypothetical protein n=1 Tax=Krasilnikovia sp. MM14-A1259 TaxID=3373539 RepID=UPI00399D4311
MAGVPGAASPRLHGCPTPQRRNREQPAQFLSTRRARLEPEQAGLPTHGGNRRVPGLRREADAGHALLRTGSRTALR